MRLIKKIFEVTRQELMPNDVLNPIIEYLKNKGKGTLFGCEIGVSKGLTAKIMFKNLDIYKMYLIDHYQPFIDKGNELNYDYVNDYNAVENNLKDYQNKIVFLKKPYIDAIYDIEDELDFIYFDATGIYPMVYDFLQSWYKLVKFGGIIGGRRFDADYIDNCRAVIHFADKHDLDLEGHNSYWWIIKDKEQV